MYFDKYEAVFKMLTNITAIAQNPKVIGQNAD